MGVRTQALLTTIGGLGRVGEAKAQCSCHRAPSAIHRRMVSICFGVTDLCEYSGGMHLLFSACVSLWMTRLASGFPGTIGMPLFLCEKAISFLSSRNPAIRVPSSGPWH